ncbi:MAG: ABC transporter permease [Candidatus Aenigmarchaeota archaeon]|nr:ABC transporter permease [Candidatus Aenigmarchaeota archaeon]
MLKDHAYIAFSSLRKRFLRTSLTMLGIFIGIASVVALISLGQGMQDAINAQFASVGTDKIIVQGATGGFSPPGQNTAGIVDKHDLKLVSQVSGVKRAAGRLFRSAKVDYADGSEILFTASIPEENEGRELVIEANNIKTAEGRLLKPGDRKKLMVGNNLWTKDKFPKKVVIGSKLMVNGAQFEVVGLLHKIGAGRDDAIMMNEDDARDVLGEPEQYSAVIAQIDAGEIPSNVADRILRALRRDRHQKEGFEDATISTSEELINSVNTILGVVRAVFIGIAAISLFVGGIGIMNTMYASVLERTRDIGIMKAIGARNSDVLLIFLLESGLLGAIGGAIGVLIGIGLSKIVETISREALGSALQPAFPPYLIVGALLFSFTIGVISGVLPARQASKLPPVEALRSD